MNKWVKPLSSLYSLFSPLSSFKEYVPVSITMPQAAYTYNKTENKTSTNITIPSAPMNPTPMVERKKTKTRLWINENTNQVKLEVFEDEMDDWPYAHTMKYEINGNLNSSKTLFIVKDMKYTTYVEDDLFPTTTTETFNVVSLGPSHFDSIQDAQVLYNDPQVKFPICKFKVNESTIYVPSGSLDITLTNQGQGVILCEWVRFYRKWAKSREGLDILEGFVPCIIQFIPAITSRL